MRHICVHHSHHDVDYLLAVAVDASTGLNCLMPRVCNHTMSTVQCLKTSGLAPHRVPVGASAEP